MRWTLRPTRAAGEFVPDREAALRPFTSLGGADSGGAGDGKQSFGSRGEKLAAFVRSDSENSNENEASGTQPFAGGGVEEDMATLVLDNLAIGLSTGTNSRPVDPRGDLDPASDAAIMLRAAVGDETAFDFLVRKYHRAMIHFLFRMVHNQEVAEELAQEVFLRVYRSRESYRAEAKFTTWLYRIATNLGVNHARDTRHERSAQTVYLDAPDEETGTTQEIADEPIPEPSRVSYAQNG